MTTSDQIAAQAKIDSALTAMALSPNRLKQDDAAAIQTYRMIASNQCTTAATDGIVFIYNPAYILGLSIPQIQGLLVHELCHCLFGHNQRFADSGWLDHSRANKAMDREINPVVVRSGYQLPDGGLFPSEIGMNDFLPWEQYYPKETSDTELDKTTAQQLADTLSDLASDIGQGMIGEGAVAVGQLAKQLVDGMAGKTYAELSGIAQALAEAAIAVAAATPVGQAAAAIVGGKKQSDHGTAVMQLDGGSLVTCTDARWQDVVIDMLGRRLGGISQADWSRPSRRSHAAGTFLPSRNKNTGYKLALVLDVSGSCVGFFRHWQAMAREMVEAIPDIVKLTIIYHDTQITQVDEWAKRDGIEITIASSGGGGTDHKTALAYCDELDIDGIVMFTDSESRWPSKPPRHDCVTVQPPGSSSTTPFGANVRVTKW